MDRLIKSTSGETTGMSRSGRVLKKSTKLTDFESPDEIDTRYKRRKDRSQKVVTSKAMSEDSYSFLDDEIIDVKEEPLEVQEWGEDPKEEEDSVEREERGEERDLSKDSDFLEMDDDYSDVSSQSTNYIQIVQDVDQEDEEENEVDFDDAASVVSSLDFEGFEEEVEHSDTVDGGGATETLVGLASHHRHAVMPITHHKLVTTTPHTTHLQLSSQVQYPYFSKKKGKKSIVMKNGQVVVRKKKTHRNDKAKARFTAYMLWAREVRQDIIRANPHMDFSAVNKRLGELWRLIPATKKYNYKRRAKRLTVKSKLKDELISTGPASCRPSLIQDNLIKKEKIKEVSLPDPKPALPLPTSSTQETGHHCNLQQKAKKDYARQKIQRLQTGGGPPPKPVDPANAAVLAMLEGELELLHNLWDSDRGYHDEVLIENADDGLVTLFLSSQKPEHEMMSSPAMCPTTSTPELKAQPMTKKKLVLNRKNEAIKLAIERNHMLREMDQELHKENLQMIQDERKREAERNHLLKEMDKELHKERLLLLQEEKKREVETNQQQQQKQKQEAEIRMLEKQYWLHKVNNAKTNKD